MATKAKDEAKGNKGKVVKITPVKMGTIKLKLVGDTPLLVHNWSTKAKMEILETQQTNSKGTKATGKPKERALKIPMQDVLASLYWLTEKPNLDFPDVKNEEDVKAAEEKAERIFQQALDNGARFGFPVTAVKKCAASTAYRRGVSKDKVSIMTSFFILPSPLDPDGLLAEIIPKGDPVLHEAMVKVGMGSSDIRYRALFRNWEMPLTLRYDLNGPYDAEDFVNMINAGGLLNGIGEWRNEKSGVFGMFHVEEDA